MTHRNKKYRKSTTRTRKKLKSKFVVEPKSKLQLRRQKRQSVKNVKRRQLSGIARHKLRRDLGLPNLDTTNKTNKIINQKNDLDTYADEAENENFEYEKLEENVKINWRNHKNLKKTSNKEQFDSVTEKSRRHYMKELQQVVTLSDVIIEVLDARDPIGCRCPAIERAIFSKHKDKIILLLINKIDLVPKENVVGWLKYLRKEFPTVAFKSNTQNQKSKLKRGESKSLNVKGSTACFGAEVLLDVLRKIASRQGGGKGTITCGVIGLPNTGKSSVINSLKRSRAVGVGSRAGFTKNITQVSIDKQIKIWDCPGVILSSESSSESDLCLRNAVKVEQLKDPIAPIEIILQKCNHEHLQSIYKIDPFQDAADFLKKIAKRRGMIKKGGFFKRKTAACTVIRDWNSGKIPYYTSPPVINEEDVGKTIESKIVQEWGKTFEINDLLDPEQLPSFIDNNQEYLQSQQNTQFVKIENDLRSENQFEIDPQAVKVIKEGNNPKFSNKFIHKQKKKEKFVSKRQQRIKEFDSQYKLIQNKQKKKLEEKNLLKKSKKNHNKLYNLNNNNTEKEVDNIEIEMEN
ncbi:guanine nucleotide-binding protein-like 3 [Anaeramoeba flamelloides]|uniref:Guanine nucleotide-binding protein-like 3 n=1 Tax=Anaeramoeba flamelloides TaxID=1746091 RepID=A0ABQ8Y0T4_9EUKA|nr:guanine nucleotide-binding protein-like 3 [Anaeramoeba flamelloides]